MSSDATRSEEESEGADPAAESTHFQSSLSGVSHMESKNTQHADAFYPSAKSMRLSAKPAARGSFSFRLTLPVVIALVAALAVFSLIIQRWVDATHFNDLKDESANCTLAASVWARFLFLQQNEFLAEHPEFEERSEWPNGDYWLVANGYVKESEWVEATGFELDEYAPISVIKRAGAKIVLDPMANWINSPDSTTEMVGIHIVNPDGSYLASAVSNDFGQNSAALRAIPHSPEYYEAEGTRIAVDYIDEAGAEPVMRGTARIHSPPDPDRFLGSVVVLIRAQRHIADQHAFLLLVLGLIILLTAFMATVCWYAARRATTPMRRLAADMQAMAEGDYSRRSSLIESNEIGLLAQAFNSMAERLRVARANEKENSRLESDLAVARGIQNNLLPLQTPRVRGLDMHASYRPAREIGGDYFDFLPIDSQHMGIVVADASGKSIPAALVMSTTRAILRFVAPGSQSASETLTRVNAILSVDIPKGMFVTAYYLVLDPLNNTMLCASAGHTPLLFARNDGTVELLNPGGIALGFDNGPIFQRAIREQRVKLQPGDRVLLYTDGVVECVNPANEEYSDRRLREFLRRNRQMTSHDFVGALLTDLDRHRGAAEMRDDTTIVTFKVL